MLKVEIDKGHVSIEANGGMKKVVTETAAMIAGLYQKFAQEGPMKGEFFKYMIQNMVRDESPVWDSETVKQLEIIEILTNDKK